MTMEFITAAWWCIVNVLRFINVSLKNRGHYWGTVPTTKKHGRSACLSNEVQGRVLKSPPPPCCTRREGVCFAAY